MAKPQAALTLPGTAWPRCPQQAPSHACATGDTGLGKDALSSFVLRAQHPLPFQWATQGRQGPVLPCTWWPARQGESNTAYPTDTPRRGPLESYSCSALRRPAQERRGWCSGQGGQHCEWWGGGAGTVSMGLESWCSGPLWVGMVPAGACWPKPEAARGLQSLPGMGECAGALG